MDRRGGSSFAILIILNPIVILFYQNCSVLPTHAHQSYKADRQVSSSHATEDQRPCRFVSSSKACAE